MSAKQELRSFSADEIKQEWQRLNLALFGAFDKEARLKILDEQHSMTLCFGFKCMLISVEYLVTLTNTGHEDLFKSVNNGKSMWLTRGQIGKAIGDLKPGIKV